MCIRNEAHSKHINWKGWFSFSSEDRRNGLDSQLYQTNSKGISGMMEWCLCTSPVKGTSKAYQKQPPCSHVPRQLLFWHSTSVLPPYTVKTFLVLVVTVITLAERRLAVKFTEPWTQDQVTFLLKRSSIEPLNGNWNSHLIPKQTNKISLQETSINWLNDIAQTKQKCFWADLSYVKGTFLSKGLGAPKAVICFQFCCTIIFHYKCMLLVLLDHTLCAEEACSEIFSQTRPVLQL